MKTILVWLARLGMAGLFLFSAWTKLVDPSAFATATANYRLAPDGMVTLIAVFLPWLEVWCGVALLAAPPFRRSAWWVLTVMMVVFTIAKASALARGLDISCGCYGVERPMTWASVGENLLLLAACVFGLAMEKR